ncbi:MAG: helix-turn-helix domain-containing protein [Nevskiales bacterium]
MSTPQPLRDSIPASAFGGLLREWRSLRKLSQLELSLQAGISQRHLSFLESGRSHPSREMVLGLTETLDIPLRERNALLGAAGFAPLYRERSLQVAEMEPVRRALELTLRHHEPYPAVVVDRDWNLVLQNNTSLRFFGLLGDPAVIWSRTCPDGRPNVMRLTFHPEGLRPFIANWEQLGPSMLNRLRREAAMLSGPHGLSALLEELLSYPGIPDQWKIPDWEHPLTPILPMQLRKDGLQCSLFTMIAMFGTPQDITVDELRLETFFPADKPTDMLLQQLAGNTG